jgi:hypothetical protein
MTLKEVKNVYRRREEKYFMSTIMGIRSRVNLHQAEVGVRKIRIANLLPEMSKEKIRQALST